MIRPAAELHAEIEAAERRVRLGRYARRFQVPRTMCEAWQKQDGFTRTQLRGFLGYCCRTHIEQWIGYVERAEEKRDNPWKTAGDATHDLLNQLRSWQRPESVGGFTPTPAEMLRLGREVLDRAIRPIAAEKRK